MNCQKCGNPIVPNSKFCTKCGEPTNNQNLNGVSETPIVNETNAFAQVNNPQSVEVSTVNPMPANPQPVEQVVNPTYVQPAMSNQVPSMGILNYFIYLIMILIKPFKCFKEEERKFEDTKNSLIFSAILAGIMMLINLLKSVISVVRVEKFSFEGTKTVWEFENLKNLNYVELILRNYLLYIGAIFVIGAIIYVASLIVKKEIKFFKTVSIAATSMIPLALGGMVLAPLLGMIYAPLQTAITIVGLIYSIIMLIEYSNNTLQLADDKKFYFYLAILSVIFIAGYFLYMKFFGFGISSSDLDSLNDLMNMFQ